MKKISFVGDIACDRLLLKSAKKKKYCFDGVLTNMKAFFDDSDYVVGNLETIFASGLRKYNEGFRYNTPDSFLDEIISSGIDMLTTANNHCFDSDVKGINRTLDLLDEKGITHTGTYRANERTDYKLVEINGIKIAVMAYTYGINTYIDSEIPDNFCDFVNALSIYHAGPKPNRVSVFLNKFTVRTWIKTLLHIPTIDPCKDFMYDGIINKEIMKKISCKIKMAKQESDITVFCLHAGGQFNEEPGDYVEYLMNWLKEQGVDVVVGHHPHTVQKIETFDNQIFAYSLGGLVMSPDAPYVSHECLPEYSIVLNIYINEDNKEIEKKSFSFVKITEDKKHFVSVYPLYDLYRESSKEEKDRIENEVRSLLKRIFEKETVDFSVEKEYYF